MTWDATAYAVTKKAIGTVESNLNYGAVSTADPITLGAFQWYGTRAAKLLFNIKDTLTSAAWTAQCPTSIQDDMTSHPASDSWWNDRIITKEEKSQLYVLLCLPDSILVQLDTIQTDIDAYLVTADKWGLDKDSETLAVEFFCTVYHQSPRAASQICAALPAKATLSDIYSAALNNSIVGPYKSRQNTAYNIIKNQDYAGVATSTGTAPDTNDGGDGNEPSPNTTNNGSNGETVKGGDLYLTHKGNLITLHRRNGDKQLFYKSGGVFLAADDPHSGAKYPANDGSGGKTTTPPVNTDSATPKGAASDVISWARSKLGAYKYSQGPGRLNPEKSGYCDCSGFLVYAFQHAANVSLGGTYTGNLCTKGTLIRDTTVSVSESILNPGDLIFLRWGPTHRGNSPFDHVEMYSGTVGGVGKRISMGHTPGPNELTWDVDINSALSNGGRVMIRRYL